MFLGDCCHDAVEVDQTEMTMGHNFLEVPKGMEDGHKFVKLPDGRLLEYSVTGDLDGEPIYFQHGLMMGCLLGEPFESIGKQMRVKWIACTMPGCGRSDAYPVGATRTLLDWPADVRAVLEQERVKKAHFLGVSLGAPHVAALVRVLPPEMIGNVCFSVPLCTGDVVEPKDMSLVFRTLKGCVQNSEAFAGALYYFLTRWLSSHQRMGASPDCKAALDRMRRELPEVYESLIANLDHAVRHSYRGLVDSRHICFNKMPFDLAEVATLTKSGHAVAITTSDDDATNPPIMAKWWHSQIEGSQMMKFENGWGHLHSMVPDNLMRVVLFLKTGAVAGPSLLTSGAELSKSRVQIAFNSRA